MKLLDAVNYVKGEYKAVVEANEKLRTVYLEESKMWDDNKNVMLAEIERLKTILAERSLATSISI
jgi:hypothetical protein